MATKLSAGDSCCCGIVCVGGNALGMRTWQSDEGLPDNTVVGIGQSPDGFLWVATPAGLVRFDGLQFRPFAPVMQAGTPSGLIQSLQGARRSPAVSPAKSSNASSAGQPRIRLDWKS